MYPNLSGSDQFAILSVLDPATRLGGGFPSTFVSMAGWTSMLMIAQVGAFGASATFDARLQMCPDNSGSDSRNISGKSITTLVAAGGDSKQVMINLFPSDLLSGFDYVRMVLNTSTTTTFCSAFLIGVSGRSSPASISNASSVIQLVG